MGSSDNMLNNPWSTAGNDKISGYDDVKSEDTSVESEWNKVRGGDSDGLIKSGW